MRFGSRKGWAMSSPVSACGGGLWWAGIVSEDKELRKDRGEPGSRQLCGLPATWTANSFKTFWLQSFAMVQARTQANSIGVWVHKSTPLVGFAHKE